MCPPLKRKNLPPLQNGISLNHLPQEILWEVLPHLSPIDRKNLQLTGDKILSYKVNGFDRYFVEAILREGADESLLEERQELCQKLPIALGDYVSLYNLIRYFDKIIEISASPQIESYKHIFNLSKFYTSEIIGFMVSLNNLKAIELQFTGILTGQYGYTKDIPIAHALLKKFANAGNQWAIKTLFDGLVHGTFFFDPDIETAHNILEERVNKGETWAIQTLYNGYRNGWYHYIPSSDEAYNFLREQSGFGNLWATQQLFDLETKILFTDNPAIKKRKKEIINEYYRLGYSWARERKLNAINAGYYNYKNRKKVLRNLIQKSIERKEKWAIFKKIEGLDLKCYGFKKNHEKLRAFIEEQYQKGHHWLIKIKYDAYLWGYFGYKRKDDQHLLDTLLDNEVRQGEVWAVVTKLDRIREKYIANKDCKERDLVFRVYGIKLSV